MLTHVLSVCRVVQSSTQAVESKDGKCRITEVDTVSGDVIANCRKGKLIFFYEVIIKVKWTGETPDGEVCNGTAEIPNLSEEQDIDDIEFHVKLTSDETPERRKVSHLFWLGPLNKDPLVSAGLA